MAASHTRKKPPKTGLFLSSGASLFPPPGRLFHEAVPRGSFAWLYSVVEVYVSADGFNLECPCTLAAAADAGDVAAHGGDRAAEFIRVQQLAGDVAARGGERKALRIDLVQLQIAACRVVSMPAAEMSSRSISPLVVCSVSTPVSSAFRTEMLPLTDERLALSAFTSEIFIYPEVVPAVIVPPRVVLTKIFPLVVMSCVSATFSSDALTAPEALDARSVSCGLTRPLTYTSPDCVAASTVPTHFSGMRRMTASCPRRQDAGKDRAFSP